MAVSRVSRAAIYYRHHPHQHRVDCNTHSSSFGKRFESALKFATTFGKLPRLLFIIHVGSSSRDRDFPRSNPLSVITNIARILLSDFDESHWGFLETRKNRSGPIFFVFISIWWFSRKKFETRFERLIIAQDNFFLRTIDSFANKVNRDNLIIGKVTRAKSCSANRKKKKKMFRWKSKKIS